jgi:hypothetical protein
MHLTGTKAYTTVACNTAYATDICARRMAWKSADTVNTDKLLYKLLHALLQVDGACVILCMCT